ncbi:MAG: hypothetical protein QM811_25790 [Pirellulales bacterium]
MYERHNQTIGQNSTRAVPKLSDELRNEVVKYCESELENQPHAVFLLHYAIYASGDKECARALLTLAYERSNDEYVKTLVEKALAAKWLQPNVPK